MERERGRECGWGLGGRCVLACFPMIIYVVLITSGILGSSYLVLLHAGKPEYLGERYKPRRERAGYIPVHRRRNTARSTREKNTARSAEVPWLHITHSKLKGGILQRNNAEKTAPTTTT